MSSVVSTEHVPTLSPTRRGGGGGESDAGERNKLYAFVVFIQWCLSLPSQKQWEFHALGKKVEEQKDRHFLECFFFILEGFGKGLICFI